MTPDAVYELRSYESPTGELHMLKVNMFNAGGEITLFKGPGLPGRLLLGCLKRQPDAQPGLYGCICQCRRPERTLESVWNALNLEINFYRSEIPE